MKKDIDFSLTYNLKEVIDWLRNFENIKKRKLKILHIGNIANNAYINSKLMRQLGIESDVLCPNYYHIMGTPEWEDAIFKGNYGSQNFPLWHRVNLNKFKRPNWFVQGNLTLSLNYLLAKNQNKKIKQRYYWMKLKIKNIFFSEINNATTFLRYLILIKNHINFILNFIYKVMNIFPKSIKKSNCFEHDIPDNILDELEKFNLNINEILPYTFHLKFLKKIFGHYDIIQGYSYDGIYPLLAEFENYTCYEHGTIRDLPFENTAQGKICKFVYQKSKKNFITNSDCLASAHKLKLDPANVIPIPHAFDSYKTYNFLKSKNILKKEPYLFIAPARHHYDESSLSWLKGNNKIIKAIKLLKNENINNFKVIFIEWGNGIDLSKNLIKKLEIENYIIWLPPKSKSELWELYLEGIAVIDQFEIPAMGSVSFEALALGCRLITHIDAPVLKTFFGKEPPVFNSSNEFEIFRSMREIINDPFDAKKSGQRSLNWINKYHSSEVLLKKQLNAYKYILDGEIA